jgi:hypothetical protein
MGEGDAPEPSLAYRWVKANVYSALFNVVTGFIVLGLGRALSVRDPATSAVTISIFVVLSGLITAVTLAVFARLTGGVLRRKLPLFPMQTWLVLHVVVGCIFGMAVAPAATVPDEVDPEPLDTGTVLVFAIASVPIGMLLGAVFGSLQALVLRKAARGLAAWIAFSALAGTMLGVVMLVVALGPQTGFANDIVSEAATFVAAIMAGLILLPAVRRLRPREAASAAPGAPPQP